ncbi:MAG: hypothetical protein KJ914_00740 [Gammaproteobacteria bacterium]|nr:hypothetical protein [Gammaproteobacteria bacterium]MBU1722247.1 hypothetical protein [Gammaproteobacteria bacterium]MBU2005354.1 hypothetical protein [Gammaproteobacteria bacterium]
MKTRINRVLLPTYTLLLLSGCTSVQNHPLYSAWQERAYSAYGLPVPATGSSPFINAAMPYKFNNGNGLNYMPQEGYLTRTSDMVVPVASYAEHQYIASHYSLQ